MRIFIRLLAALALLTSYLPAGAQTIPAFAKGADISWITELEANNYKFYNRAGQPQELFQLLRDDYGLNTIRLRVWVNPPAGYNGAADVLAKAKRAQALGQRLLLDFHYSDDFADPGKQTKPVAWQSYSLAQLKQAVYDHTAAVLTLLKTNNITPEWVQVGNETTDGMLWPEGRVTVNGFAPFAQLIDQGYAAVKAVSPTTKVIVHAARGEDNGLFRYLFDGLQANGARWDVIGLSLYPDAATWNTFTTRAAANMNDMVARYPGKEVMVVETGLGTYVPIATRQMLLDLLAKTQAVPAGKGLGVLYWEPEAYNWQGYGLGVWDTNGRATAGLDGFLAAPPATLVYNPGFEYTAATQAPLGWATTSATDADADYTEYNAHGGQFRLTHYKATAYQVRTFQTISGLPNGTYTLRAWVQNGGGQTTCQLYAQALGSAAEQNLALPVASTWTQVLVPGIVVSGGQCEIGLRSVANAGNYCSLDDVELVPAAALATVPAAAPATTMQLFPNPTAGPLSLSYTLARPAAVQVALYNSTGQHIRTLAAGPALAAGPHRVALGSVADLAAGIYLVQLTCEGTTTGLRLVKVE